MGSLRLDGVWFSAWSHDHEPPHVHARYGETRAIVSILPGGDIDLARRKDAIRPPNGKQSDVRHILDTASKHADILNQLWEKTHG